MHDDRIFIAISGKQRRGKDTVCDMLTNKLNDYQRVSVSDLIITEVASLYSFNIPELIHLKNTDGQARKMIIQHGWDMRKRHGDDYWIKQITDTSGNVVMPSLRLLDEVLHIKEHEPFNVMVRVECNEDVAKQRGVLSNTTDPTELNWMTTMSGIL